MLTEIFSETSTNGRWGVKIVGEQGTKFPAQGKLVSLGTLEGHKIFKFIPGPTGQWILPGGDLAPVAGCEVVYSEGLQSSRYATIVVGGPFFAVREYGYKGRSNWITAYKEGVEVKLSAAVMAAMGLLPADEAEVVVETPPLPSALAEALRKAGLAP